MVKDNILSFPQADPKDFSDRLNGLDLETITDILIVRTHEERVRPELIKVVGEIPSLLAEYLTLDEWNKSELDRMRTRYQGYLNGEEQGYGINYLESVGNRGVALLARKCRCVHQLLKFYEFYKKHGKGKKFNNHYITHDQEMKEVYRNAGYNLVQNVRKMWGITMKDIIALAAEVEPEICRAYWAPGESNIPKNVKMIRV